MQVEVQGLTRTFGRVRANASISLTFAAGHIHAVLGENGAGKSTLMKLLAGFLRPDAGNILLNGRPVRLRGPAEALRQGIGMVHQDPLDVPAFTALENVALALPRCIVRSRAAVRQRLLELAADLEFAALPDTPVMYLSVGQRQQLEMMRLLLWQVQVLILDEPTTGISAAQKDALFAALRRMTAEGKTVLFVSHKLAEVAELCDTVSVLRAGAVAGTGQLALPQPREQLLELMFGPACSTNLLEVTSNGQRAAADLAPTLVNVKSNGHPASNGSVAWELRGVCVREGPVALQDITLSLPQGSITGLAGLTGSGQDVLLRLLAGLLRASSGRVFFAASDMSAAPLALWQEAGVQYVPADRLADGLIGPFSW